MHTAPFEKSAGYHFAMALSECRQAAGSLVRRMYAARGLAGTDAPLAESRPHEAEHTLVARAGDEVIGTVTLRLDCGAGLLAEQIYDVEIAGLRRRGARLCELTRLALAPGHDSLEVLTHLFKLAYLYCRERTWMTDVIIEVNPRHAGFYRRMVGFRQLGPERTCARVGAPAVLLHLEIAHMDRQIALQRQAGEDGSRSIYSAFRDLWLAPATPAFA